MEAAIGRAILVNGTVAQRLQSARRWRLKNYGNGRQQQQQQRGKLSTGSSTTAAATAGKKRETGRAAAEAASSGGGEEGGRGRRGRTGGTAAGGAYVTVVSVNCSSGEGEDKQKFRCVKTTSIAIFGDKKV